jgi:hypothetical protein
MSDSHFLRLDKTATALQIAAEAHWPAARLEQIMQEAATELFGILDGMSTDWAEIKALMSDFGLGKREKKGRKS